MTSRTALVKAARPSHYCFAHYAAGGFHPESQYWRDIGCQRVAALIVSLGLLFSVNACTYEEPVGEESLPGSVSPAPRVSDPEPAVGARQDWGPDAMFYTDAGIPYSGENKWESTVGVASFTTTSTGVVYVDAETSGIVWEDWEHAARAIGRQPWLEPSGTRVGYQWGEFREIVGNPSHDLVSWVETIDGHRGDIVVVQPSTGKVLARTGINSPPRTWRDLRFNRRCRGLLCNLARRRQNRECVGLAVGRRWSSASQQP